MTFQRNLPPELTKASDIFFGIFMLLFESRNGAKTVSFCLRFVLYSSQQLYDGFCRLPEASPFMAATLVLLG